MSDVYVARQPIFDKEMNIYGYELLYRKSQNNFFEGESDDEATAAVMDNFFHMGFEELLDGSLGFVNFAENLLIKEVPLMLPKDKVVIEILERTNLTDEVVEACRKLKEEGYIIALDDFIMKDEETRYAAIMEHVDIIKIEFAYKTINDQMRLLKKYKDKITFLAEKVETREDYALAIKLGYSLFQGYFFCKPMMMSAKSIGTFENSLLMIINELNKPEPDYDSITSIFERDLELSYKLLRLVNSAYYGVRYQIESLRHAAVQLGAKKLAQWINLLLLKGLKNPENSELIKASIIRGKMLSMLAILYKEERAESDYFIAGIFTSIDVLLGRRMDDILSELPLEDFVKEALLGQEGKLRKAIDLILCLEKAQWESVDRILESMSIPLDTFMSIYNEAIKWQKSLI